MFNKKCALSSGMWHGNQSVFSCRFFCYPFFHSIFAAENPVVSTVFAARHVFVMETYLAILLSLLFSAFFSGMEIAFVSSNKLRFELDKKQRSLTSRILSVFYRHPQQYISTMLVGNNICLVIFSMLMAQLLAPYFYFITNDLLLSLVQSIIATIIVLFVGEFLPKTVFRYNANLWLRVFAPFLYIIYIVLYPIAIFSTWISMFFLWVFHVKIDRSAKEMQFSRVDLNYLIQESMEGSAGEQEMETEVQIFQNALDFSKVKLRDCCVPRTEIMALPITADTESLKNAFIETGYSKILIYKTDVDNIIGYIHASEMFEHQKNWQEHINTIPIVPENMAAQKLMKLFLQEKKSIAVVVDEFGGTAGIVTFEYTAEKVSDSEYLLSGRLEVEEVNRMFGLSLPESEEYETIAGLILHHCGHFLKVNEQVKIGDFSFKCLKATDNRIDLLKLMC